MPSDSASYQDLLEPIALEIKDRMIKALSPYLPLFIRSAKLKGPNLKVHTIMFVIDHLDGIADVQCEYRERSINIQADPHEWKKQFNIRVKSRVSPYWGQFNDFSYETPNVIEKVCEKVVEHVKWKLYSNG